MLRTLGVSLALALALTASPLLAQDEGAYQQFSPDQLDNLLAPVALYPDPLLAQVLIAATFPDQIDDAARFVRDDANPNDVDDRPWDVSVKAVAHYPAVLEMMADKLDWTIALGQAYVNQSTDVMASVQHLRAEARAAGNLANTPQMEVVESGGDIELWPAQPQYIFVPVYDPGIVFFRRAPLFFGARFFIGAWLNYDFDWRQHRVFYHGWEGHDRGWMERSRPYVHVTKIYVNNNYRNVAINRDVIRRNVNYPQLDRYGDVHRGTNFENVRGGRRAVPTPPPQPIRPEIRPAIRNKIIDRNFNTNDPRLNGYRGHVVLQSPAVRVPATPAFTPTRGGFDPKIASERGRASRSQPPPPTARKPVRQIERKKRP